MAKMKIDDTVYEVVVIGGGIVGATAALALAQAGFRVLVVDPKPSTLMADNAPPDIRVSAISCGSVALLLRIGAWQRIGKMACVPYRRLETWEWASSVLAFNAASLGLPELGFIVENRRLQQALWQGFADCDMLTLRSPASLADMVHDGTWWRLTLTDGSTLTSRLMVGADGAHSWVRREAGITIFGWQYRQSCLLITIETEGKQQDVTWQEFHPSGPRAFLPLYGPWASLIWYDDAARIRYLATLPLSTLTREVQAAFPARLGPFTIHDVASCRLTRHHARHYVKPGLALIGDAAHSIHPLAGQGANLGLRDAEALVEVLIAARCYDEPWETLAVLERYQRRRRGDNLLMQTGMDALYTLFSNDLSALMLVRNLGLMLSARAGGIKQWILRYALGL